MAEGSVSEDSKTTSTLFNREKVMQELDEKGYVVIPGILTEEECNAYVAEYKAWHDKFEEHGLPIEKKRSLIQSYRVGQLDTTWQVRLKSKRVFACLWQTEKLLTSIDGIALSRPPTTEYDDFRQEGQDWLHLDQGALREGLHAYQGAVYLEEQTQDDYCFRVIEKSHKFHTQFYEQFPRGISKTNKMEFIRLKEQEKRWYYDQGAALTYVPVPKGGIVLWDSRTVHDSSPPKRQRMNSDRWRFVVFVSMTPAHWASKDDMAFKKDVYRNMHLTSHWSSQGLKTFKPTSNVRSYEQSDVCIKYLGKVARTREAKLLAGVESYNFNDGTPNGPGKPRWRNME